MRKHIIIWSVALVPALLAGCATGDSPEGPASAPPQPAEVDAAAATPTGTPSLSCEDLATYRTVHSGNSGTRVSVVAVPVESVVLPPYVTILREPLCAFTSTGKNSGLDIVTVLWDATDPLESWDVVDTKGSPDHYYN